MGEWFRQIFREGIVVAVVATMAVILSWPWRFLPIVVLLYVFFFILRDPRSFYRRMFRLVLGAVFILPGLQISIDAFGLSTLPAFAGVARVSALLGGWPDPWVLFGFAVLCVLADLFQFWFVERPSRSLDLAAAVIDHKRTALVVSRTGVTLNGHFHVNTDSTSKQALSIVGASLRIKSVMPLLLSCTLYCDFSESGLPMQHVSSDAPAKIKPGRSLGFFAQSSLPPGLLSAWLRWRTGPLAVLRRFRSVAVDGELLLGASFIQWQKPIPIRFELHEGESTG